LYRFSAQPGDIWQVPALDPELDTAFKVHLDTVTHLTNTIHLQHVTNASVQGWQAGDIILKGVGGVRSWLPYRGYLKQNISIGLRCFYTAGYNNKPASFCKKTFQLQGLELEQQDDKLILHPDTSLLYVKMGMADTSFQLAKPLSVSIFNTQGEVFVNKAFKMNERNYVVDITDLAADNYFIKVKYAYQSFTKQFEIKGEEE
jgi:hypothetical protein